MPVWPFRTLERDYTPKMSSAVVPPPRQPARETVTPNEAMSLAAVYRAVSIISTSLKGLPIEVYRGPEIVDSRLAARPDVNRTYGQWVTETVHSLALHGNCFWWLSRNDTTGEVVNVTVLRPERVSVVQEDTRGPIPIVRYYLDTSDQPINDHIQHLRLNQRPGEVMGFGPIQSAGPDLANALRVRQYGNAYFDTGTPVGVLSTDQILNQAQATEYRDAFSAVMRDRSVAVLGSGMSYSNLYQDPAQTQLTDVQMALVTMVTRLFGIPPTWMAAGVEGVSLTYVNSEHLNLSFVQTTLNQYITAIEDAFTDIIPRGQVARIKLDALLRSDLAGRVAAYKTFHDMGVLSADEIRASEGIPGPAPGAEDGVTNQPNDSLNLDGAPL